MKRVKPLLKTGRIPSAIKINPSPETWTLSWIARVNVVAGLFSGVPYPPSAQLQAGANSQPNFPPSTASALADTTQASLPADLNNAIDIKSTDVSSLPISISDNNDSSTQDHTVKTGE